MSEPSIGRMFHPTLLVDDLADASDWFARVMGRRGVTWGEKWDLEKLNPAYPIDYSIFVHVGQVVIDALCPRLLVLPSGDAAPYPAGEGVVDIAWYSADVGGIAQRLAADGIRSRDQNGVLVEDGVVPESNLAPDVFTIWTYPDDTGLTYEFMQLGHQHIERYARVGDPRLDPSWSLPEPAVDDPLGILSCSHHTILTADPDRAVRLFTETLGGRVLVERYDGERDADSVVVRFSDGNLEFLTPRKAPPAHDNYVRMTFAVRDVAAVRQHLHSCGVPFIDSVDGVHTLAVDTFGVEWSFIGSATAFPTPDWSH